MNSNSSHINTLATGDIKDYLALMKPRIMSLVVFSGCAGLIAAPNTLHPLLMLVTIACIAIGCGGASCINMWHERYSDALMIRTRNRPIVQGRIAPAEALSFGIILSIASVYILAIAVNWSAATLLATAILFYVFVYTIWLKPRTPHNIVIGGAAGAFPPMIGWSAATGEILSPAIALFLLIFLWTPPHFWALALYRCDDYRNANIPMLPVTAGEKTTKKHILIYTITLLPASLLPYYLGIAGGLYATTATALSVIFIAAAIALFKDKNHYIAKKIFAFSIFYLFALLSMLMIDTL